MFQFVSHCFGVHLVLVSAPGSNTTVGVFVIDLHGLFLSLYSIVIAPTRPRFVRACAHSRRLVVAAGTSGRILHEALYACSPASAMRWLSLTHSFGWLDLFHLLFTS